MFAFGCGVLLVIFWLGGCKAPPIPPNVDTLARPRTPSRRRTSEARRPKPRPGIVHSSLYLPEPAYEALLEAAFRARCKIHDIVLEVIGMALRKRGRRKWTASASHILSVVIGSVPKTGWLLFFGAAGAIAVFAGRASRQKASAYDRRATAIQTALANVSFGEKPRRAGRN